MLSVPIEATDRRADVESRYGGRVVVWRPEAGFAVLGSVTGQLRLLSDEGEWNRGAVQAPEHLPSMGSSSWSGGWDAWGGGWDAWGGGWDAWGGGGPTQAPMENQAIWLQVDLPSAHTALSPALGRGVTVAVLDTGVDVTHPVFRDRLAGGWDFVDDDANPSDVLGGSASGHGTGVAGIIVQVAPGATIMPLRVLDEHGLGDTDDVAEAIDFAVANGADVINLSLGSLEQSDVLATMVRYAADEAVYVISAAGNQGEKDGLLHPAASALAGGNLGKRLISVGSVDGEDIKSIFSNYGNGLELVAPGESILTTAPGERIGYWSGTSFAAPMVTGAVALALAEGVSGAHAEDFSKVLGDFADDIEGLPGNRGFGKKLGKGRLNIAAFLRGLMLTDYSDPFTVEATSPWDLNFATETGEVKLKIASSTSEYNHRNIVPASAVLRGDRNGHEVRPTEVKVHSGDTELVFKDVNAALLGLFADTNIEPGSLKTLELSFAVGHAEPRAYRVEVLIEDSDERWVDEGGEFLVEARDEWKATFPADFGGDVKLRIHDAREGGYNHRHVVADSVTLHGSGKMVAPTRVEVKSGHTEVSFHELKPELWALLADAAPQPGSHHVLTLQFAIGDGPVRDYPVTIAVKP